MESSGLMVMFIIACWNCTPDKAGLPHGVILAALQDTSNDNNERTGTHLLGLLGVSVQTAVVAVFLCIYFYKNYHVGVFIGAVVVIHLHLHFLCLQRFS